MNTTLLAVKEALRQIIQIDTEMEAARQLKKVRPELIRQLELAEEFYLAERKRLLDLEDLIPNLTRLAEALTLLFEEYETERLTLVARSLTLAQCSNEASIDTVSSREEFRYMLPLLTQRCEKIGVTIQEIRQVLNEYSSALSDVPSHGLKQKDSSSGKSRWTR